MRAPPIDLRDHGGAIVTILIACTCSRVAARWMHGAAQGWRSIAPMRGRNASPRGASGAPCHGARRRRHSRFQLGAPRGKGVPAIRCHVWGGGGSRGWVPRIQPQPYGGGEELADDVVNAHDYSREPLPRCGVPIGAERPVTPNAPATNDGAAGPPICPRAFRPAFIPHSVSRGTGDDGARSPWRRGVSVLLLASMRRAHRDPARPPRRARTTCT